MLTVNPDDKDKIDMACGINTESLSGVSYLPVDSARKETTIPVITVYIWYGCTFGQVGKAGGRIQDGFRAG